MLSTHQYIDRIAAGSDILYRMEDGELRALQLYLLSMLKDILQVCEQNGLCVMLSYGSTLGAVRHGGFIPWDDDLDLMMPRRDYDRFIELFPAQLGSKYDLMAPGLPGETKTPFAKIIDRKSTLVEIMDLDTPYPKGAFIDIFPLELCPVNPVVRQTKRIISMGLAYICGSTAMYKFRNDTFKKYMDADPAARRNYRLRKGVGFLFSFLQHKTWCRIFDRFSTQRHDTGLYHTPSGGYSWRGIPQDALFPADRCRFEDIEAPVPHDTDRYLKNEYGDYMAIPPVEKRQRHYVVTFKLPE